jgi:hypothetical protein
MKERRSRVRSHIDQSEKWLLVVEARIDPEVEEEWNRWYDDIHMPEMMKCPGYLFGARYLCEGVMTAEGYSAEAKSERRYLTVYWLEGPEAVSSEEHERRKGWGKFASSVQYNGGVYRPLQAHCDR